AKPAEGRVEDLDRPQDPPKSRRQGWSESPAIDADADRFVPRGEAPGLRPSRRSFSPDEDEWDERDLPVSPQRSLQARQFDEPSAERGRRGWGRALVATLSVLIVLGIALAAYWQRDRVLSLFARSPAATQAQRRTAPSRPNVSARAG